ncbi:hypothetical protein PSEUDO8O_31050 [Pseudomonas sp. 8O]|nr:hypothetical protein PSEUDO8O_31050 [Pseudomonas sp. 8O]
MKTSYGKLNISSLNKTSPFSKIEIGLSGINFTLMLLLIMSDPVMAIG